MNQTCPKTPLEMALPFMPQQNEPEKPSKPDDPPQYDPLPSEDETRLYWWRYAQAEKAGMSHLDAAEFARRRVDTGELRRLVRGKCPSRLLARILL